MSKEKNNIIDRLRAELMNPHQHNRQLIHEAHEEIKILRDEVVKAHVRSIDARTKFEGRFERLKDASIRALTTLAKASEHYDKSLSKGDPHELWALVTEACKIIYRHMDDENIKMTEQDEDTTDSYQTQSPEVDQEASS
jgi:hypothetical protein